MDFSAVAAVCLFVCFAVKWVFVYLNRLMPEDFKYRIGVRSGSQSHVDAGVYLFVGTGREGAVRGRVWSLIAHTPICFVGPCEVGPCCQEWGAA